LGGKEKSEAGKNIGQGKNGLAVKRNPGVVRRRGPVKKRKEAKSHHVGDSFRTCSGKTRGGVTFPKEDMERENGGGRNEIAAEESTEP